MRAMFARGAFTAADAAAAGATLAAYAIGLIPFVMIRSAVSALLRPQGYRDAGKGAPHRSHRQRAAEDPADGIAGAGRACAGHRRRCLDQSVAGARLRGAGRVPGAPQGVPAIAGVLLSDVVLGTALWFAARFAAVHLAQLTTLRDETTLVGLIAVGAIVHAGSILLLFGKGWLRSLVRS
jgi:putative peptidoglycan lipid II flippase